ncbi:MAG: YkvA family protein [Candidatus Limnocylindria bacterium]
MSSPFRTPPEFRVNLSSSSRYLRMARLVVKLPTYARIVWGLIRDPRTPIGLKGMLVAALAYVVMPVDLIPDVIPILGQADDLTVLLLVLDLFIQNAPAEVRAEHSARARNGTADLDRDVASLRVLMGDRFDRIKDDLPDLLDRYGRLRDPDELKRALATWRRRRTAQHHTPKELE